MKKPRGRPRATKLLEELKTAVANQPDVVQQAPAMPSISLSDIRDNALRARSGTAKIIAELEAMSEEIDATLAFLRAQRKR